MPGLAVGGMSLFVPLTAGFVGPEKTRLTIPVEDSAKQAVPLSAYFFVFFPFLVVLTNFTNIAERKRLIRDDFVRR